MKSGKSLQCKVSSCTMQCYFDRAILTCLQLQPARKRRVCILPLCGILYSLSTLLLARMHTIPDKASRIGNMSRSPVS